MAAEVQSCFLACRAMGEGHVIIGDIVEEVDLLLLEQETGGDRVDGSIAPSLVEKATILVQRLEEIDVCLGAQPVKVADLEVGPLK